jgi:PAS domain S-box-containing protein
MEGKALSLLILEDNPDDAELAVKQLEQEGINLKWSRVDTEEGFRKALAEKPDLILAAYRQPSFDARAALQIRQQIAPEIPLIIISGTTGEEVAVECMKSGATDYVFKDRLFRLASVVKLAIEEAEAYREGKRAEEALRESEGKLSAMLQSLGDHMSMMDKDFNILWANDVAKGMFGDDIIGKKCYEVYHGRNKPCEPFPCLTLKAFEDGQVHEHETWVQTRAGKALSYACAASVALRDDEGRPSAVIEISRDITERKRMEESLRESEAQKQALLDGSPDMIMQIDTNMTLLWANKTALDMNPDAVGQTCHKAYVNRDEPCQGCPCKKCMDTGQIERGIVYQPAAKGIQDESYWEDIGVPVKDNHGRIVGAIEIARNITDRKKAEEVLRETRDYLENLINHASAPIIVWDLEFRITRFNNAFERLTGYAGDEVIGQEFSMLFSKGSRRESLNKITHTLKGEYWKSVEIPILCKDGDVRHVLCNSANVYADDGTTLLSTIVQGIDITQQKHLEAQIRQTQKMEALGTLAGGIAHDFNNMLYAVIGYAELALGDAPKGTLLQSHLQEVVKAANRAKDLVKQILTFSRQTEDELRPVQVKLIVKEALKLLRASLPTTIEIRQNIQSDSVVLADPAQIQQVLMNLCTNAAHVMREEGGILEVSLSSAECGVRSADLEKDDKHSAFPGPDLTHGRNGVFQSRCARAGRNRQSAIGLAPGPHLRLTVSDTGHGMTPDVMERIFEPFFTTKEVGEGTGMGLSVVHGTVKSLGGTITVDSQPGNGSTFRIYLPLAERELEPEVETEKAVPTGEERILFIDDEQVLANMGKQMLERLGYEVASRTSSIEALELFRAQPDRFDLVITDMTMPNMTGEKLAAEIMNIRPDIPIILCTGFSEHISEEKAKEMGIRTFVMKPLARRDLAGTIRKVLDK